MNMRNRHSIRLPEYDYTQPGAYFLTLVTHQRQLLFGEIFAAEVQINPLGRIVTQEWENTPAIRKEIGLDEFVVMPNHIHGIIVIRETDHPVGAHSRAPLPADRHALLRQPRSVGAFVAGFKSVTTKRINLIRGTPGLPVWQRNYYEHVIRDEEELTRIRAYILENPFHWNIDDENPSR